MSNESVSSDVIGIPCLLTIVFIVLKLTKVISWSWVWVLAPTWIPLALIVLIAFIVVIYKALTE